MYHPYFRGKQYELLTIRENAKLLATAKFVPIIEPVKESLGGLQRAVQAVCDAKGAAIVIVNPHHGDHSEDGESISSMLQESFKREEIAAGILLKEGMSVNDALACCQAHNAHPVALIHSGFTDAKGLASALGSDVTEMQHVFLPQCGPLYRKHFKGAKRVLLKDGFKKRPRNRDYPPVEPFSDLHVTFEEDGFEGFGDFLIVGDEFSETGGPAYAVAIHLTFIDPTQDDAMFIYHFISDRQDTPADMPGKFGEALSALMRKLKEPDHHIFESEAVAEFRDLYERGHFPGLGYVKKLSMKHHIETLNRFFE